MGSEREIERERERDGGVIRGRERERIKFKRGNYLPRVRIRGSWFCKGVVVA